MSANGVFFLSGHEQQRQNAFIQNNFFLCFLNLAVKSTITKMTENNIFEGMTF